MNFTDEQEKIIAHPIQGHIKVPAVAGAGKSTVLVGRIKHLISHGVSPNQILVVMFNVAAKDEFTLKLKKYIGGAIPDVRTFHSLGFKLVDSFTKKGLLAKCKLEQRPYELGKLAKQSLLTAKQNTGADLDISQNVVEEFTNFVDRVKSDILPPTEVFTEIGISKRFKLFLDAFDLFEDEREVRNIRFFSDLIYDPVKILLNNEQARDWIGGGHVEHILLDEYQDINAISQYLIKVIANGKASVTCVGDADQCIYDFRGSRPEYIVDRFDSDFPLPSVLPLTRTFRYGHSLSLLANHVITNNKLRDSKICNSDTGNAPTAIELYQDGKPHPAVRALQEWVKSGRTLNEAAILVRLFSMSVRTELALLASGLPYKIEGQSSVLNIPDIDALINILRLANGTLFNGDPLIQAKAVRSILSLPLLAVEKKQMDIICQRIVDAPHKIKEILSSASMAYKGYRALKIEERGVILSNVTEMGSKSPVDILDYFVTSTEVFKQLAKLSAFSEESDNRIETIESFISYVGTAALPLNRFLDHVRLLKEQEQNNHQKDKDYLLITSVHRAKGLEWPLVILPELCENKFPYIKDKSNKDVTKALESERRLFYVAVTRTREKLVLITPKDNELVDWIKAKRSGYPAKIVNNDKYASRFVYEANLKLSSELGKKLHSGFWIDTPLSACSPEIANQYLISLGIPSRVSKTTQT